MTDWLEEIEGDARLHTHVGNTTATGGSPVVIVGKADLDWLIAEVRALRAQVALARALIAKGEPIVAKDDVELECGVCHGTRWGPCEDIPVALVLNDTVQHTHDCEWAALDAALAERDGKGE